MEQQKLNPWIVATFSGPMCGVLFANVAFSEQASIYFNIVMVLLIPLIASGIFLHRWVLMIKENWMSWVSVGYALCLCIAIFLIRINAQAARVMLVILLGLAIFAIFCSFCAGLNHKIKTKDGETLDLLPSLIIMAVFNLANIGILMDN